MDTENRYLTVKEVATLLNLSDYTIKRFAREKRIPAVKVEGRWLFSRKEVDEWLMERKNK